MGSRNCEIELQNYYFLSKQPLDQLAKEWIFFDWIDSKIFF